MVKAIRFNAIDDSLEYSEVTTDWKIIDGMYYAAKPHGPYLMGELWKDTELNRGLIRQIIELKRKRITFYNEIISQCYNLLNHKEK